MTRTDIVSEVATAIADADGVALEEVPPLYDYIAPEILEKLVTQSKEGDCRVVFQVAEHRVTVTQDSQIFVDGTQRPHRQRQE